MVITISSLNLDINRPKKHKSLISITMVSSWELLTIFTELKNQGPSYIPRVVIIGGSDPCLMVLRPAFKSHSVHKVPTSYSTLFGVISGHYKEKHDSFGGNIPYFWHFSPRFGFFTIFRGELGLWNLFA